MCAEVGVRVQLQVVGEGICAMLGLVVLDLPRELAARGALWGALVHAERHVLLHDRALAAQPDEGNYHITHPNTTLTFNVLNVTYFHLVFS